MIPPVMFFLSHRDHDWFVVKEPIQGGRLATLLREGRQVVLVRFHAPDDVDSCEVSSVITCGSYGYRPWIEARLVERGGIQWADLFHQVPGSDHRVAAGSSLSLGPEPLGGPDESEPAPRMREADWCDNCKDVPAGHRWLCRARPHRQVPE